MNETPNTPPNRRRFGAGFIWFAIAAVATLVLTWFAGTSARSSFLAYQEEIDPIIAGGDLDELPAVMRGGIPSVTTSLVYAEERRRKPPRMCEMEADYFDGVDQAHEIASGYTNRNEYVRKFRPRRGFLNEREMRAAKVAWHYFEKFTQETTGLANSVGNYPSTTLWDTASYIAGAVAAYELCLIEKNDFDQRMTLLLTTIKGLELFRNEMPNKVYHTKSGLKVDYTNKAGEIGFSALDIGRFMVWLRILKNRYPYLGNTIDSVLLKWDFSNAVSSEGLLFGAYVDKESGETVYAQEGRLGYEEYAAKGFALWGFRPIMAHRAEPFLTASIFGIQVPYDGRDPRVFHSQNYVVTESYLQDGLELGFDMPHDDSSPDWLHSDGWRAEFADRIYMVQENRWRRTGFMTARSEHNVKGPPYFTYDTIFSDGYPWNTVTPRGDYTPDHAAVAAKAALGLWALWDTEYTDVLYNAIIELYDPENGMYEGLYERGQGRVEIYTANNNGIILTALLHKVQGKILTPYNGETEVWYTAFRDQDIRERRKYPDPIQREDWLPALRHSTQKELDY
ncbi:DUF3131 domain-containing protein [Cognatishimia activa]|uniref:DUF3131 domain-containing protein n=1 Tax=Cognatishimia activa TaxID=1715691 RepID=A0A0P1IN24_9RHOB|nr:DUF3131 domain-containing protein [Cognatishimia activa]CUJ14357.1 hypothetical protein TA5113_02430 [Cognatishimia activa]CUK24993.1 hypothetical protein TA5114_00782 [Cognatishimia activa]